MATAATELDVRADFPILKRRIGEHRLVYLDSSSTSQKPEQVLAAMDEYYRNHNANIHRGVYPLAVEADALFEGARERIAAFTGGEARATIFAANVTAAINLVAYSWARTNLTTGDAVLVTEMEHHANIVPWQLATAATGGELRWLEIDEQGMLSLDQLDAELARGDVKLVALAHVSNVLGTINPVAEIVRRAHDAGALVLIDARAGGAADAGRHRRDRCRLLRLDWSQGARADGHRGPASRPRAARADAAVPCRRRHDRERRAVSARPGRSCRGSSRPARR